MNNEKSSNSHSRQNAFGNNPWQKEEKEAFITLLRQHGKNFQGISQGLASRSVDQCRNFFQNYKSKLNLSQYLREVKQSGSSRE